MSTFRRCDGCHRELGDSHSIGKPAVVIHGERADGMKGGFPLPDEDFDWCGACAKIGFQAVVNTREAVRVAAQTAGNLRKGR